MTIAVPVASPAVRAAKDRIVLKRQLAELIANYQYDYFSNESAGHRAGLGMLADISSPAWGPDFDEHLGR